jgi:hypothetical protein
MTARFVERLFMVSVSSLPFGFVELHRVGGKDLNGALARR